MKALSRVKFSLDSRHNLGRPHCHAPKSFDWAKKFKEGREAVQNESHQRRPRKSVTDENIRAIRDLIESDRRLTINKIAMVVQVSHGSAHAIITEHLGYVILLHDNARPHTAALTQEKLDQFHWEKLEHPPYSPDLSPCDFHLFGPLKEALGGQHFENDNEVEQFVCNWLKTRPQNFYQEGIQKLPTRWEKCINVERDYIEKL